MSMFTSCTCQEGKDFKCVQVGQLRHCVYKGELLQQFGLFSYVEHLQRCFDGHSIPAFGTYMKYAEEIKHGPVVVPSISYATFQRYLLYGYTVRNHYISLAKEDPNQLGLCVVLQVALFAFVVRYWDYVTSHPDLYETLQGNFEGCFGTLEGSLRNTNPEAFRKGSMFCQAIKLSLEEVCEAWKALFK